MIKGEYPSIDLPQSINSTFFEKNPLIPNTNIYTTIKLLSAFYKDRCAVNCFDLNANYGKLLDDAVTISVALKELGAKKGQVVSVCMPNFYQALATFLACSRIGVVTTFIDSRASIDDICYYLNEFETPIFINYNSSLLENKQIKSKTNVKYVVTLKKKKINSLNLLSDYRLTSSD